MEKQEKRVIILERFRSIHDWDVIYLPGQVYPVSEFGEARLQKLLKYKVAKLEEEEDEKAEKPIDLNLSSRALKPLIGACENVEALQELLKEEEANEEPRKTVIDMISKRLEALAQSETQGE